MNKIIKENILGIVTWINVKNEFGFIKKEKEDKKDTHIRFSTINVERCKILKVGQHVKFDIKLDGPDGVEATNIIPLKLK